jgi:hypothetical protein
MNSLNKNYLLLFFAIILLNSCDDFFETSIEIDPPSYEKKLAIIGEAKAGDSEIILKISESIGVLENDSLLFSISGVNVSAKINNVTLVVKETKVKNNTRDNIKYTIEVPQKLKGGDIVKIEAKYKDLPIAVIESKMPLSPKIENVKLNKSAGKDREGNELSKLEFNYHTLDPTIYLAGYYENQFIYCNASTTINGMFKCNSYDTTLQVQNIRFQDPEAAYNFYLKKSNADQLSKEIIMTFTNSFFSNNGLNNKTIIILESHNNDGYNYLVSARNYNNAIDNPFSTPVNIYSNVKNGYGILILSNNTRLEL